MRRIVCWALCSPLIFQSCASLTKTQIESVNQFAKTTTEFSAYPSKIMVELAEIRANRGIYYANTLSDPKLHIQELDDVHEQRQYDLELSAKMDVTFKIIDKYAQSLQLLSSDKFEKDLEEQAKNFGVGIDSLIALHNSIDGITKAPTGIGGAIGGIIVLGGKQHIRIKQAKEIKNFVSIADSLVSAMADNLLEFLESKNINELIENEEKELRRNYLSFLQQTPRASIDNERDYLELKNSIVGVKELQEQTIRATKNLRKAHKKLLQEIEKRKKLKETIEELQRLYQEIENCKKTIDSIDTKI